ncbi:uncharacterized protein DUF2793 [Rhodobacter sp. JA431]|uniref:DUF2793 domain-containing protein n=1 Tax=Rhodobacter sp. JA431 TaxID=570013 RepID=UPI000BCDFE01|nr:DUF2793 domain-containing protein [Rhodobacter sp. JA431]SOC08319.1 uncharacterized protein DUF2793 [Rhodobacter sp. JA431]
MADQTPLLGLPHILPSQAQKHVTHNEALILLDAVVQLAVLNRNQNTPPATPAPGDRYIIGSAPTSAWAGHAHAVALYTETGWIFATPQPGWSARDLSDAAIVVFDGSHWAPPAQSFDNLAGVGINASADTTNRLTIFAQASLFSHDGAGHQMKINKALPSDTASLLFQTSWSGRAEMGTTGSDDFAIKVSADGSGWTTALSLAAATGLASGAAIQQSPSDTTPGRLMRSDYGYGPGNLLGPVSQNGGLPDGAVLERGTTADGDYLRLADGTQICFATRALGAITASGTGAWDDPYSSAEGSWSFPTPFIAPPVVTASAIAPAGSSTARRRALAGVGDVSTTAASGVQVIRLGADPTVDAFSIDLLAVGRWV